LAALDLARRCGWAEHVSASGERIVCFTPPRLADYVESRLEEMDGATNS
jgi:hypothetical protein